MRKIVISFALFGVLALAATAYAATPQGKLTGASDVATTIGIERIVVAGPIRDGETVYVNVRNDRSGDCDGDTGRVLITYSESEDDRASSGEWSDDGDKAKYDILCAHYVGDSMTVSYFDEHLNTYVVFRIRDNGSPSRKDRFTYATTSAAEKATLWVNVGTDTSGNDLTPLVPAALSDGNFQVKA
jgi:hypothetical protein